MFQPERAEHQLILACAKPGAYTDTYTGKYDSASALHLDDEEIDWSLILDLASRHRIAPLLHYFLCANPQITTPAEVAEILKKHAGELALTNLFQTNELVRIVGLIEDAGLSVMPFKGPALGQYLYGNLGIRPFGDLDILIKKEQFSAVKQLLLKNGYRPFRTFNEEEEKLFIETQMGFEFIREDEQCVIEVHWSFLNTVHSFKLPEDEVWHKATRMTLSGRDVRVFAPDHLLIYLCAHGSKSLWARLRWLCDVAEVAARHTDMTFWNNVYKQAKKSRSVRMLNTGLRLAMAMLDIKLPAQVERRVNADIKATLLASEVIVASLSPSDDPSKAINPVSFHLKMHERFRDRIPYYKHLFQIWSAPSSKDKAFVALPRYLEFLYVLIKPIRMILKRQS